MKDIKFDWNDITLVPAVFSDIRSRKEINHLTSDGKLPLFIAPMDTVVDANNISTFLDMGFDVCVPRGVKNDFNGAFTSFGLEDIEKLVENNSELPNRVLIDIANGHSIRLYEVSKKIKEQYPNVELMVGNIANPKTYEEYAKIGVDYIRCGIGGGASCFVDSVLVTTDKGYKKISDIKTGDSVLTHMGIFKKVINTISFEANEPMYMVNGNKSTDHEYYVIDKINADIITDDNIHSYARWILTSELDKNTHLLVELK